MRIDFRKQQNQSDGLGHWLRLRRATRAIAACLVVAGISAVTAGAIESIDRHTLDALAVPVLQYTESDPMSRIDSWAAGRAAHPTLSNADGGALHHG